MGTIVTLEMLEQLIARNPHHDRNEPVKVLVDLPSVGPQAHVTLTHAGFGFDWDRGLLLKPEKSLVPKEKKQDIFEDAYQLLLYIATKPEKKQSYEKRTAKTILARYGIDQSFLDKFQYLFLKDYKDER